MSGAICGGNQEEAKRRVENAHCKQHDNYIAGCSDCERAYIDALDANFMALMKI